MNVDLSDYVAGGYFITKYSDDGFWRSPLMPERIVSISPSISDLLDVVWGWNPDQYAAEIQQFGIPSPKIDRFQKWCSGKTPGALYSLEIAQECISEFLTDAKDLLLIGIGLHPQLVDDFLAKNKQFVHDPNAQVYLQKQYGVNYMLNERNPLPENGSAIGFEVVGYWNQLSDSWLTSNLQQDMHELYQIHPNKYGLINSYDEAKKVYAWIAEDELKGTRAEPIPYHPWLIVQYPLT